ncbi:MaoC/PaaZ C-terminal domain-containing protein [Natronoarchaeum sp. GCM10025703]|uniref:MaoC/PaaZ C-terminal domain-containing protein n=1 Tax=unclassified Natronoarchaeum TaxID=2620183 RepID=UPI0036099134
MDDSSDTTVYFEDVDPGTTTECGSTTITESEIVEFAERYDPLEIHTETEVTGESPFGGLIASGYHTLCLSVRLLVEAVRRDRAVVGGLGLDSVSWNNPVEPGDTLTVTNEVVDTRPSDSNSETGVVHEEIVVTNQAGESVLSYENFELVRRRD